MLARLPGANGRTKHRAKSQVRFGPLEAPARLRDGHDPNGLAVQKGFSVLNIL
jgi:hypothetical protein